MTCNNKCIHFPVCEQKKYDFANIDECQYYEEQRPHGECKVYHAMFEDRISCKCGFMNVVTGHWDDYNYCPRCGRKAQKEGESNE